MYEHIALAVDLTDNPNRLLQIATQVAQSHSATLNLFHVIDYAPLEPVGESVLAVPASAENQIIEQAKQRLDAVAQNIDFPIQNQWVELGSMRQAVTDIVNMHKINLVIVGNHERRGLGRLLGGNEDAILHAAPCDILAVRI